jgi:phosphoserine phosphatase RsbU/P
VFVVGDVAGKGMGASLLMSAFLASARVLYDICLDPGELARRLGAITNRTADGGKFVTGVLGCIDPATGVVQYVNAGHPAPCIVKDGKLRMLDSNGVPFGTLPDWPYQTSTATLEPGETLAVFSDGIPEAQHGEDFFDDERLHKVLIDNCAGAIGEIRTQLIGRVREFVGDEPRSDDVTLLLIRREAS